MPHIRKANVANFYLILIKYGVYRVGWIVFNIKSFYPSISTKLFDEAISFAKLNYDFTSEELEIIMHSRKTLLFWKDSTWVKKMKIVTYQWDVMMAQKYVNW